LYAFFWDTVMDWCGIAYTPPDHLFVAESINYVTIQM
jgi:hypothetical protein